MSNTPIHTFLINNHSELISKISKWNLTQKEYPENFPKDKIKPLQEEYITIEDYRLVFIHYFILFFSLKFHLFFIFRMHLKIEYNFILIYLILLFSCIFKYNFYKIFNIIIIILENLFKIK